MTAKRIHNFSIESILNWSPDNRTTHTPASNPPISPSNRQATHLDTMPSMHQVVAADPDAASWGLSPIKLTTDEEHETKRAELDVNSLPCAKRLKAKMGRSPRVPFTKYQVGVLESRFQKVHYLSSIDVTSLSIQLKLTETRVKIWFQNRRARERRERAFVESSLMDSVATPASEYNRQAVTEPISPKQPLTQGGVRSEGNQAPVSLASAPDFPLTDRSNPLWAAHALAAAASMGIYRANLYSRTTRDNFDPTFGYVKHHRFPTPTGNCVYPLPPATEKTTASELSTVQSPSHDVINEYDISRRQDS